MKNLIGYRLDMEPAPQESISTVHRRREYAPQSGPCGYGRIRILTTNGPKGPEKTIDPGEVIAIIDIVAVDAYGAGFFKIRRRANPSSPRRSGLSKHGYDHGWEEIDLTRFG